MLASSIYHMWFAKDTDGVFLPLSQYLTSTIYSTSSVLWGRPIFVTRKFSYLNQDKQGNTTQ